jgi:hypothetical protein
MSKELFLECDCYSEGIKFNYDEDGFLSISLYQRGFKPRTKTWREKLRWIWQIISKDVPYDDEVLISKNKIQKLSEFMNEIVPNNIEKMNEVTPNNNEKMNENWPNIDLKKGTLYKIKGEDMPFRYIEYSRLVNTSADGLYHFKYHQLKTYTFSKENLSRVEREATSEEVRMYNLTKQESDRVWKEQNSY